MSRCRRHCKRNKSAVSLVNNRGNIGAALKELGSSANVRALITSMVTAGLTTQITGMAGLGKDLPKTAPLADRVVQDIQRGLIRATVKARISTALEGGKLDKNLLTALRLEASSVLGKYAAQQIGDAYKGGDIDKVSQLIAHAALGCATGAMATGDCKGGAVGGVIGEITADWLRQKVEKDLHGLFKRGEITREEAVELAQEWRASGINVSRIAAGLAAALAGGDVDTGANAGGNAAENNAWPLAVIAYWAIVALTAVDIVLTAKDAYDLAVAGNDCYNGSQAACDQATEMAVEAGIDLGVSRLIPGAKAAKNLTKIVRDHVDADTVKKIDKAISNKKQPDIQDHKKHHDAIVEEEKARLKKEGNRVSEDEITFKSCDGNGRCRPDITYETPDGQLRGTEVKTGKAKLSKNQDKIYDQMKEGTAIPVGKNAKDFGLKPGVPLKEKYPDGAPVKTEQFPGLGK